MSASDLKVDVNGGVARITLNRPQKRNALTRELLAELLVEIRKLEVRSDLRILVLSAAGPVFCAGMDLAQMQETASRPDATVLWTADTQSYCDVLTRLYQLDVPTVALVQGPALAGGFGLVLACDIVLAAETATFSLPEPKRGITAAIVTPLLVHRLGAGRAAYLLLSGRSVAATAALHNGICHALVPDDQLETAACELVQDILTGSPAALAVTKGQLRACASSDVVAQLERAVAVSAKARETSDAREGLQAFLEKRDPSWRTTT